MASSLSAGAKAAGGVIQPEKLPAASAGPAVQRLIGKMILITDDESLMRDIAKDILEPEGATLFFATNGEEALQFLAKNHSILDLVVLDVVMPKVDGIKTFKELRKLAPNLPVVFSSGYAESEPIALLRQSGDVSFIQKPYRADHLMEMILKYLPIESSVEKAA